MGHRANRAKVLAAILAALVLLPVAAEATVYDFPYASMTSTVRNTQVSLTGGTVGSSSISGIAPNAASATETSILYPHYVAITLKNVQTSATGANFPQTITFNPSTYSAYETSNLGNIRFCADAACATQLDAWLESCTPSCTTSATTARVWVKLSTSIAARSAATIFMDFLISGQFDGNYWGEAPSLSGTYGQYDNGANVFTVYDNFVGTTLSSVWQAPIASAGGTVSVNNGLTFNVASGTDYVFIATASTKTYPLVTEMLYDPSSTATTGIGPMIGESTATTTSSWIDLCPGYEYDWTTGTANSGYLESSAGCTPATVSSGFTTASSNTVVGFAWSATGSEHVYANYASIQTGTDNTVTIANYYPYMGISNLAAGSYSIPWARARVYPPAGVMPTVTIGSVITVVNQVTVPLTLTNTASTATPVPFQEKVTLTPSTYTKYEGWDLGNIRFCSDAACTSPLYAWLESCTPSCTPAATSAVLWVKLTTSIPGSSGTITIYMEFLPGYTEFDGNYLGENPTLSPAYAAYDNGASVFLLYFNGNTATSSFTVRTGYTLAQVTGITYAGSPSGYVNVLRVTGSAATADAQIALTAGVSQQGLEEEVNWEHTGTNSMGFLGLADSTSLNTIQNAIGSSVSGTAMHSTYITAGTSTDAAIGITLAATTWFYGTLIYPGSTSTTYSIYGGAALYPGAPTSVTANPIKNAATLYLAPLAHHTTATGAVTYYYDWGRARAYPPGNTMPGVAFGSVTHNYFLALANGVSSSWNVNLGVASTSNTGRLYNLTIWFYTPTTVETRLGSGVTQLTSGPVATLSASGTLYIALYASSTSTGSSTVTLSLMVRPGASGPYAEYTIVLTVN